jgi:hypothetical protein
MARVNKNIVTQGLSGKIGKQVVFKTRNDITFISVYPDRSKVVPSEKQLAEKSRFAEAVHYAKSVLADSVKKAEVAARTPKGKLVYHQAIKDYLNNNKY